MPAEPHKARNRDRSILTSWVDGYHAKKNRFMQVETNTEFYIYALTDPRGFEIKYIGVSLKPEQRFHSHVNHQRFDPYQVDKWIEKIQNFGYDPIMILVEKCVAKSRKEAVKEGERREEYWIRLFSRYGCDLENVTKNPSS